MGLSPGLGPKQGWPGFAQGAERETNGRGGANAGGQNWIYCGGGYNRQRAKNLARRGGTAITKNRKNRAKNGYRAPSPRLGRWVWPDGEKKKNPGGNPLTKPGASVNRKGRSPFKTPAKWGNPGLEKKNRGRRKKKADLWEGGMVARDWAAPIGRGRARNGKSLHHGWRRGGWGQGLYSPGTPCGDAGRFPGALIWGRPVGEPGSTKNPLSKGGILPYQKAPARKKGDLAILRVLNPVTGNGPMSFPTRSPHEPIGEGVRKPKLAGTGPPI